MPDGLELQRGKVMKSSLLTKVLTGTALASILVLAGGTISTGTVQAQDRDRNRRGDWDNNRDGNRDWNRNQSQNQRDRNWDRDRNRGDEWRARERARVGREASDVRV
jgi:hypothetical protein